MMEYHVGHTKYKNVEELELLCTAEENVRWYHCFGRQFLQKLNFHLSPFIDDRLSYRENINSHVKTKPIGADKNQ